MPSIRFKNFPHSSCPTAAFTMPSMRDFCCPGIGCTQTVGMHGSTLPPLFPQMTWAVSTLTSSAKAPQKQNKNFHTALLPGGLLTFLIRMRVFCWSGKKLNHLLLCAEWSSVYERQLCQIWIPCGAGIHGFTWAPYCSALCAFCLVPRLQQGRYLCLPLCVHIIVLSLLDADSPSLPLFHAPGSYPWLALNLPKCWEVPGELETKVEFRPPGHCGTWKPYVSVLNEQRTCPFFYRDGFPWELCYERVHFM